MHGRPLHFTNWRGVELDLANDSRLAMHVEPIYFLLAPIYWLWQQPETILILQTVILALGALPVFWLARDRLGSHLAGVAFAAVYLLFPGLEAANMWEFHAVALAAPCCSLRSTSARGAAGSGSGSLRSWRWLRRKRSH